MNRKAALAAFATTVFGFILLAVYLRQFQRDARGGELIELLTMRQDVPAGRPVTEEMLAVRTLPERYIEDRQVRASELSRVLGVRSAIDLNANHTLLWTDLATTPQDRGSLSSRIPKGMRAISITGQARRTYSDLMRPGDRVDVLLTKAKPGLSGEVVTVPLLQNLLILAVGSRFRAEEDQGAASGASSVTLLVTIDQASLLVQARRDGTLSIILRNEDDLEVREGLPETNDSDVLAQETRARRQRRTLERVD